MSLIDSATELASQINTLYINLLTNYSTYSTEFASAYTNLPNFTSSLENISNNTFTPDDINTVINNYQDIVNPLYVSPGSHQNLSTIINSAYYLNQPNGNAFIGVANLFISMFQFASVLFPTLISS
jgi:hypothetical protein